MEKWMKMTVYGLDQDIVPKVVIRKNKNPYDKIVFSKYAKIGLNNFLEYNPRLFLSRLSKGPPPQFRFLAWKVASSRKLKRQKGLYGELLTKSSDEANGGTIWAHDIMKDLD